jgi:acylphosphatase
VTTEGSLAVRFILSGRVQGVGFRWWAVRQATALGLAGWVRNLPDGRVELVAQGRAAAVDNLERVLQHGPPLSRVENVEKTVTPHHEIEGNTFQIR